LNSAIENWKEYQQKLKDKSDKDLERENFRRDQGIEDPQEPKVENNEAEPEEKIVLKDFEMVDKRYVLTLDTLGQDREYSPKELEFIEEIALCLKTKWEKIERNILLRDRDNKLKIINYENEYKSDVRDK